MKAKYFISYALALVALSVGRASADDLNPPPWRGQPLTTLAAWDFITPIGINNPSPPDGLPLPVIGDGNGPTGVPLASISNLTWTGSSWSGVLLPPGEFGFIDLFIPNWIDQEPIKLLQIQLTVSPRMASGLPPEFPHVFGIAAHDPLPIIETVFLGEQTIPVGDPIDNLWHRTERWRIRPNPDREQIRIVVPSDSLVSQIVVDTISFAIPEPGTLALAGLAVCGFGAVALRRRLG